MLLQQVVAARPDDQSQSTSFGKWCERNPQGSFCSSCRMTPGCFAEHFPTPSMMHAPGIALATSVTCLYTQECQLRQGGQRMHVVACAPTRGDQRLQPAARASAVARAVRRRLRARRMAVEGQHVVRRHVACEIEKPCQGHMSARYALPHPATTCAFPNGQGPAAAAHAKRARRWS